MFRTYSMDNMQAFGTGLWAIEGMTELSDQQMSFFVLLATLVAN